MEDAKKFFEDLYQNFNDRKIEAAISKMNENVKWANAMDGGYVHGHIGVREYWTRQFSVISANVTPLEISEESERVKIKVHQVVHDVNGQLLGDELVYHYFRLHNHKIVEFDVGDKVKNQTQ